MGRPSFRRPRRRLLCGGLVLLGARAAADEEARYRLPAFFDYDCTIPAPDWTNDWTVVHTQLVETSAQTGQNGTPSYIISPSLYERLVNNELFSGECPLGVLFISVVAAMATIASGTSLEEAHPFLDVIESQLVGWPFFVVACSRWPIYQALLALEGTVSGGKVPEGADCGESGVSDIDWARLKVDSHRWFNYLDGRTPLEEAELVPLELRMRVATNAAWGRAQRQMVDECPFGMMSLLASRAMALSTWDTSHFENPAREVDGFIAQLEYKKVILSGWPIISHLAIMSSMTLQGKYSSIDDRFPKKKLFREFGDLQLTKLELCPFGRNATGWARADSLAELSVQEWLETVPREILARGGLRPVFAEAVIAVTAALNVTRARGGEPLRRSCERAASSRQECGYSGIMESTCRSWGCCWAPPAPAGRHTPWCFRAEGQPRRKLVFLIPIWGERWAALVEPFAEWASKLRLPGVVVVAMGPQVREACAFAAIRWGSVACWSPLKGARADARGSLLQRHVLVHVLVHLGLDVLSLDFDTFLFQNPARRTEETAEALGADVLLTGHFDANCLNTGAIYVRSSARAAEWYSQYLSWLHAHPYEDEQRGLNALLNYTGQGISFRPKRMPPVRGGSLEDANEFVSSRGGWLGDYRQLHLFHFVAPSSSDSLPRLETAEMDAQVGGPRTWQELKVLDLDVLYVGALSPEVDLNVASFPDYLRNVDTHSHQNLTHARAVMDLYIVPSAPQRAACW